MADRDVTQVLVETEIVPPHAVTEVLTEVEIVPPHAISQVLVEVEVKAPWPNQPEQGPRWQMS